MFREFKTVWLLVLIAGMGTSVPPLMLLIGGILGSTMAPSPRWATMPIALMIIGTACAVLPVTRCMARLGRRMTFFIFFGIGALACLLAGEALARSNFVLFCLAGALIGATNAALQQARFAAMESVPVAQASTAASIIMCSGLIAAFLGPEMAVWGRTLSEVEYRGSFWLGACCFAIAGALVALYKPKARPPISSSDKPARTVAQMLHSRTLVVAIAAGAIAFIVMTFVMTATPISMHLHHGHSLEDTKFVIQSHIAAMFLPSLLTAWLFRLFNIRGVMIAGLLCYAAMIIIGLHDVTVVGFWGQLVMLGIGWNFLFVSGTALLPTTHSEGERFKAQGLNDSVVFSAQAIASLLAGWAMSLIDWQSLLLLCLAPMVMMVAALFWHREPV
jgi:MFS family permease